MSIVAIVLALASSFVAGSNYDADVAAIVRSERAFAAAVRTNGTREGFIAHLDPEGVIFRPAPLNGLAWFAAHRPASPPPVVLAWAPAFADVSFHGDIGYTTGGWELVPSAGGASVDSGTYVTIWRKRADGRWRVALDCGVSGRSHVAAPSVVASSEHARQLRSGWPRRKPDTAALVRALAEREGTMQTMWRMQGARAALEAFGLNELRVLRSDQPMITRTSLAAVPDSVLSSGMQWSTMRAVVAASGDLAYTYGTIPGVGSGEHAVPTGFVRIWRKDRAGAWKLVLDLE